MKKIKLTMFLNILLSILVIASIIYCYFNYKNAELRYGIKGINENEGKIKTKIEYEEIPSIHYNENGYYFEVLKNNKYGFVDEMGNQIIECKYGYISRFNEYGLAEVGMAGKRGVINSRGEQVIKCEYDFIYNFNENGYAKVIKNEKYGIINTKGEEIIKCEYDYMGIEENRYIQIGKNDKYGLVDINAEKIILDCEYDQIFQCFQGEFLVKKDDTYYYYKPREKYAEKMSDEWKNDFENKFVILKSTENYIVVYLRKTGHNEEIDIEKFDKNRGVWIEIDGKYGYINKNGEFLVECKYNYANPIYDGKYTVVSDGNDKCGLMNNETLELVIECKYEFIHNIDSIPKDYLVAIDEETNYILDKQGNIIKKCNYGIILKDPYNPKYYVTTTNDNKMGIIDENFNEILECKYDKACVYKDIIICVEDNGRKTILDLNLNEIKRLDEYDDVYYAEEEYIIVKKDDKYGVIDFKGNEILECKYYNIHLEENLVVVGKKEISISFMISTILGSIFAIALVINNISSKRRKDF